MSQDVVPSEQSTEEPQPIERRPRRGTNAWLGGAVLVLIGIIFLVRNISGVELRNWWAVFILIPAVASLGNAWREYNKSDRQLTRGVRGSLIGGVILLFVACVFFFDLDWGKIWPVFVIIAGISALLAGLFR